MVPKHLSLIGCSVLYKNLERLKLRDEYLCLQFTEQNFYLRRCHLKKAYIEILGLASQATTL